MQHRRVPRFRSLFYLCAEVVHHVDPTAVDCFWRHRIWPAAVCIACITIDEKNRSKVVENRNSYEHQPMATAAPARAADEAAARKRRWSALPPGGAKHQQAAQQGHTGRQQCSACSEPVPEVTMWASATALFMPRNNMGCLLRHFTHKSAAVPNLTCT